MNRPLNIAHRGFHKELHENTLEAFQAAIDLGVDGIEFDVHETGDNHFVVFHDPAVRGMPIKETSLARIQKVRLEDRYKIPTLEEALGLCRGRVKLMVEIKQARSLERLVSLLRAKAEVDDIFLASFHHDLLLQFATLAPEIKRCVIIGLPVIDPVGLATQTQTGLIAIRLVFATKGLVMKAHAAELKIFVWGFRSLGAIKKAIRLGADGLVSNSPDLVQQELAR